MRANPPRETRLFTEWKSQGSNPGPQSVFRNPLLYSSIALVLGAIYVAGVFLFRWEANRAVERRLEDQHRAADAKTAEAMGGNRFDILNFYISPPEIHPGDTAHVCYGVSNAKTVTLDPPAAPMWPAFSRCVPVTPDKDTTYTLSISDGAGHTKTESLQLKVH
jgi:hypothetical protein